MQWPSPLQGATWGAASAVAPQQMQSPSARSARLDMIQPVAQQQQHTVRSFSASQHVPGAGGEAHASDVGRQRMLEKSGQTAARQQELDGLLQDMDRMEGWVQKRADQEAQQRYLAGNHDVREDAYTRADALKAISSQLGSARPDAVLGEAEGTGGTPMTGDLGGLAPPKWNNPNAAVPSNFTFDAELKRLQVEVEAIRSKTQKDLGLSSSDAMFFV